MILGSFGGGLCLCDWITEKRREMTDRRLRRCLNARYEIGQSEIIQNSISQLEEYFNGERREFSIPLRYAGSTFQCAVWSELLKIPYGMTLSYAEVARRIGNPKAVRAVASANARNPISIFVPCHRVIGSNGKLRGYGGGLNVKEKLLMLEGGRLGRDAGQYGYN